MTAARRCPHCGAGLPEDAAANAACPACLFKLAFEPVSAPSEPSPDAWTGVPPGKDAGAHPLRIGPYRILTILGQGGMGVVYLAEQEHPIRRKVALKVVKVGMDSREVVARFDTERQALALMSHPNIARVLDAGASDEGRPYFVMEYVPGIQITDYCDRSRLSTRDRLALFITVCQAVQHAHQKGVIHRDLKPSNVLVAIEDGRPVPKVIDFGIAKATHQRLTEQAIFTRHGVLIGTPEYMSPEQADPGRLDVDTTTDVYSLGVILYELLVGVLPFDGDTLRKAAYVELVRIIQDEEPARPSVRVTGLGAQAGDMAKRRDTDVSSLRKQLRGDLDWIVLRALEKDRTRRYASASEFAADIERHLADEAVMASPPSVAYRVQKFVRRHRLSVAAALAVVLALAAGLAVSTRLYVQVRAERQASDHGSYLANIAAADAHVRATEGNDARRRLLAAPSDLRNWEWRYLWAASMPVAATLPAGDLLAVSGRSIFIARESRLEEWDRVTFERTASHPLAGEAVAADPEGRRVLVRSPTGNDPSYAVVDVATGQTLSRPALGTDNSPRFAPDGSHFVTRGGRGDGGITWWDAETGRALATRAVTGGDVYGFTPDSRQMLIGAHSSISLWTPESGQEAAVVTLGNGVSARTASVTPDGTLVITAGSDGLLREWDVRTHVAKRTYGKQQNAWDMAISADGRFVAVGSWASVAIWDRATGIAVVELKDGTDVDLSHPLFSPDGSQVFAHGRYGDIRVWDIRKARLASGMEFPDTTDVVPSADGGHVLARRSSGALERWDLDTLTMEPVASESHPVGAMAISEDGQRVAAATNDGSLLAWTDVTSAPLVIGRGTGSIRSIAFSGNGVRIAAVWGESRTGGLLPGPPHRLRAWDISAGRQLIDVAVDPAEVAFDGTGRRLVVVGALTQVIERKRHDGMARSIGPTCNTDTHDTLQVWDLDSGRKTMGARKQCAHAAAFTSDDAFVVADSWETPVVMHAVDGSGVARRSEEMPVVMSLAVSPDGSRIALGTGENQVVVLDARTLEALLVIRVKNQATTSVVFSADGTRLITTAGDGSGSFIVHVYDTRPPHEPVTSLAGGRQKVR
jgi:eukaryotic-like serine/threonine-protein kinase